MKKEKTIIIAGEKFNYSDKSIKDIEELIGIIQTKQKENGKILNVKNNEVLDLERELDELENTYDNLVVEKIRTMKKEENEDLEKYLL